jgi:hypothetical protein
MSYIINTIYKILLLKTFMSSQKKYFYLYSDIRNPSIFLYLLSFILSYIYKQYKILIIITYLI